MRLSAKIMALSVLVAALALVSASGFGYYFGVTESRNHINAYLESEAQSVVCQLEGWLSSKAAVVKVLQSVIESLDDPEDVDTKLIQHYRRDEEISDIYIGFEDGRFVSGIGWVPPKDYDPRIRPWYRQAKEADRLNFSEPYLDMTTGKHAVSVGIPLRNRNGQLIGILGADILLETLTHKVQSIDLGGLGYGFLLDKRGTGLSHPIDTYVNQDLRKNPETAMIVETIMTNRSGLWEYDFKGVPKLMVYKTLPSTGWFLGLTVERSKIYAPLRLLRTQFFIGSVLIFIAVLLESRIFSRRITKRLNLLMLESSRVAEGKPAFDVVLEGDDEITELAGAFSVMARTLSDRVWERDEALRSLDGMNTQLEMKVEARTVELTAANQELLALNDELISAIDKLRMTQRQLIESERMAALGGMVSGIAHEINTPLGNAITGVTFLEKERTALETKFLEGRLHRQELEDYIKEVRDLTETITGSLSKVDGLIRSFKSASAEQSTDAKRVFDMKDYMAALITSLDYLLKPTGHQLKLICPEGLTVDSYPAAFSQIISNLLLNSIRHGYPSGRPGVLKLEIRGAENEIILVYSDDGQGMEQSLAERVFEPFTTTRRGQGNMGLGLHLVYNIVKNELGGEIQCDSDIGQGTRFEIVLPR